MSVMEMQSSARDDLAPADGEPGETAQRRGRVSGVLHTIGVGLSAGLLLLMLGLAIVVIVVPIAVGGNAYTVLTGSMRPNLPPGTLLIVTPAAASEIQVGDVITYQLESGRPEVVTHRVIERINDTTTGEVTFRTQGDANNAPDPVAVREVQIRGEVWYAVPYIGWVNNALNGELRAWLVPLIAGVLLAYAAWMLVGGIRERLAARRAGGSDAHGSDAPA